VKKELPQKEFKEVEYNIIISELSIIEISSSTRPTQRSNRYNTDQSKKI